MVSGWTPWDHRDLRCLSTVHPGPKSILRNEEALFHPRIETQEITNEGLLP